MVVAIMLFAVLGGLTGSGSAIAADLPLWLVIAAYPAGGTLCAVSVAAFVALRPGYSS